MNKQEVEKLSELSKIELTEEEKETFSKEINDILGYVSDIQNATGAELPKVAGAHRNVFREDENPHEVGEFTEAILREAPETQEGYIKVKKIL